MFFLKFKYIFRIFFFLSVISLPLFLRAEEVESLKEKAVTNRDDKDKEEEDFSSSNLNMYLIYGQYNIMRSNIDFSSQEKDFAYLLNSSFNRSNDYGYRSELYENTSYYNHNIGFTGDLDVSNKWKAIMETQFLSDSRGMFDNSAYSREDREVYNLKLKNLYKMTSSFESYITLGNSGYSHRLEGRQSNDRIDSRITRFDLESGGEFIWSDFNRIHGKVAFSGYYYSYDEVEEDQFFKGTIIDDFKISDSIGVTLGLNFAWNKEIGILGWNENGERPVPLVPILGLSIRDLKNTQFSIKYIYDIENFQPEEFYFEQSFVNPNYDLPSSKVHVVDVKFSGEFGEIFNIDALGTYKKYNNYLNYEPVTGDVLSAYTVEASIYQCDIFMGLNLLDKKFKIGGRYYYFFSDSEETIVYKPSHRFKFEMEYSGTVWYFKWDNMFQGEMATDVTGESHLEPVIIGNLDIRRKFFSNLHAYVRIENLYNKRYYLREDYPEPGIIFSGGMNIQI